MSPPFQASKNKALLADVSGVSNPNLGNVVFALVFLGTFGWFTDTFLGLLQAMVTTKELNALSFYVVSMLPFIAVLVLAYIRWSKAQKRAIASSEVKDVCPHSGVICFLSEVRNPDQKKLIEANDASVFDEKNFSWNQTFRGLQVHGDILKKVWVICSSESKNQYQYFEALFSKRFPHANFEMAGEVGFEDVSSIVDVLEEVYQALPSDMDETDVMIDITSGQKPTSIAGFMASLVRKTRKVQYVQTSEPYAVKTYRYDIKVLGKSVR